MEQLLRTELRTATLRAFGSPGAGCISEGRAYETDAGPVFVKVNRRTQAPSHLESALCTLPAESGEARASGSHVGLLSGVVVHQALSRTGRAPVGAGARACVAEGLVVFWMIWTQARQMFEGEMASLEALRSTGLVRAPRPLKVLDLPAGGAVFVMEYLKMKSLSSQASKLGDQMADLHLYNQRLREKSKAMESTVGRRAEGAEPLYVTKFGFHTVTCCGFIPQVNEWQDDWATFFTRHRLQAQLDLIEKDYADREARELWSRLQVKIPDLFCGVEIVPALLHGDLWSGNVAEDDEGPIIYDPASFYGHSEFELAIALMFGGFPRSFFTAYHRKIPKSPGFDRRLLLYQLFNYLNHWNHFGPEYRSPSLGTMRKLLK
ncbi:Fructosamine-3-kinase [Sciurus carolinensis]|uniref:protein-ribulosamine 3-kinase n=1 Tax=Sciurus carolinensis TaxID=30640 RepID=A0AA41MPL6_SCICA|nr:Fructosamine-3-kinase [Sciurus carolinensis]